MDRSTFFGLTGLAVMVAAFLLNSIPLRVVAFLAGFAILLLLTAPEA